MLLGSPHWPDAKFQEKHSESLSQRDLLLSKSEVEMAFCFQETTCKGVAFSQHNLLLSIDRDLNAVYLNHLHSCRNNWHFQEVTVIGILKQCIEARIAEPSHYESFWMVWFKMPWLYCFMQMWFLCTKPPTVSKALISFPVTAKWQGNYLAYGRTVEQLATHSLQLIDLMLLMEPLYSYFAHISNYFIFNAIFDSVKLL